MKRCLAVRMSSMLHLPLYYDGHNDDDGDDRDNNDKDKDNDKKKTIITKAV